MAFYTGTTNTFADLKTIIETVADDMGWSISNGVLSKNGAFIKLTSGVVSSIYTNLMIESGTGQSGSSLTGASKAAPRLTETIGMPIQWPATYLIHAFDDPDEIYVVLRVNVEFYLFLCFGVGGEPGVGGTGCWSGATWPSGAIVTNSRANEFQTSVSIGGIQFGQYNDSMTRTPFWLSGANVNTDARYSWSLHHGLNGGGWQYPGQPNNAQFGYIAGLWTSLPSPFNEAHVLLPMKGLIFRPDGGVTIGKQNVHARFMRIDNVAPEDVIEYGGDKWKCYPMFRKNSNVRNGSNASNTDHSGTFGVALRYDGS